MQASTQPSIDAQSFGLAQNQARAYQSQSLYQSKTLAATGGACLQGGAEEFEFGSGVGGLGHGSILDEEEGDALDVPVTTYPRTASNNFSSGRTQFELFRSSQSRVIRVSV